LKGKIYLLFLGALIVNGLQVVSVDFGLGFTPQNLSSPFEVGKEISDFNIAVVGDMGCSSVVKQTIGEIKLKNPELILALGDLSYQKSSANCWFNIVSPVYSKMKIVLGDHDYRSGSVLKQYRNQFNLSKDYYSFNYHNVHFIALATEIPFDKNSTQYSFVRTDLEKVSKNPDIRWIIVFCYRPQYSSPSVHPGNGDLRDVFHPLFQKYKVDLILQGHNHNYQRSYPINYNEATPTDPMIVDHNLKTYQETEGQIYLEVGTGGAQLHRLGGKAPFIAFQQEGYGFLDLSFTSNGENLTGIFYSSNDNAIQDSFTVIK